MLLISKDDLTRAPSRSTKQNPRHGRTSREETTVKSKPTETTTGRESRRGIHMSTMDCCSLWLNTQSVECLRECWREFPSFAAAGFQRFWPRTEVFSRVETYARREDSDVVTCCGASVQTDHSGGTWGKSKGWMVESIQSLKGRLGVPLRGDITIIKQDGHLCYSDCEIEIIPGEEPQSGIHSGQQVIDLRLERQWGVHLEA